MKKTLVLCTVMLICFSAEAKNSIIIKVLKTSKTMPKIEAVKTVNEDDCTVYGSVQSPSGAVYTSHATAPTCAEAWNKMIDRMEALEASF